MGIYAKVWNRSSDRETHLSIIIGSMIIDFKQQLANFLDPGNNWSDTLIGISRACKEGIKQEIEQETKQEIKNKKSSLQKTPLLCGYFECV